VNGLVIAASETVDQEPDGEGDNRRGVRALFDRRKKSSASLALSRTACVALAAAGPAAAGRVVLFSEKWNLVFRGAVADFLHSR
jgi:hypothetical protein